MLLLLEQSVRPSPLSIYNLQICINPVIPGPALSRSLINAVSTSMRG